MSSEWRGESGKDEAGDVEKCVEQAFGAMFESTHHCCRGVAACSEYHCWSFLLTAPWNRERTHTQMEHAVKHIWETDKYSRASPNPTAHPLFGGASRSKCIVGSAPRGTQRMSAYPGIFAEAEPPCWISTPKTQRSLVIVLFSVLARLHVCARAKCVLESWKNCVWNGAALDLDRKTSFPVTLPPPRLSASHHHPHHYHRIQTQTHIHFHTRSPFPVPSLPFTSSTSTGLSKWSQRIALWSNNPGGWHRRDGSVRGGEGTREVREVEKVWREKRRQLHGEEARVWTLRCMEKNRKVKESIERGVRPTTAERCSAW